MTCLAGHTGGCSHRHAVDRLGSGAAINPTYLQILDGSVADAGNSAAPDFVLQIHQAVQDCLQHLHHRDLSPHAPQDKCSWCAADQAGNHRCYITSACMTLDAI